ncbi:MAG: hypothetical protein MMC33_004267 [Icmadophila ericetorum]|nr:hypothetical protein [Icmadophila ericetorum]
MPGSRMPARRRSNADTRSAGAAVGELAGWSILQHAFLLSPAYTALTYMLQSCAAVGQHICRSSLGHVDVHIEGDAVLADERSYHDQARQRACTYAGENSGAVHEVQQRMQSGQVSFAGEAQRHAGADSAPSNCQADDNSAADAPPVPASGARADGSLNPADRAEEAEKGGRSDVGCNPLVMPADPTGKCLHHVICIAEYTASLSIYGGIATFRTNGVHSPLQIRTCDLISPARGYCSKQ